jgi:threonine/homoserine/homoserine lactone efflux protein
MNIETAFALFFAMIISAIVPGPGVFACIAKALASGFKASMYVILGIVLGNVIFLLLAVLGLSAIAQMAGDMFLFIKWAGGAYLFWLGWKMWTNKPKITDSQDLLHEKRSSGLIGGLFVPFSNPKVILFYVSLLPSFVNLSTLNLYEVILSVFLIVIALVIVLATYSYIASRSRQLFTNHKAMRNLNRCAGITMMGTGVVIAIKSN